jgi:DNA-binding NtrC family response regulator
MPANVVVLDVNLPDISGLDVLQRIRASGMPCEAIVVTAEGSVNRAVEAMRFGAFDFIVKPFSADRLRVVRRQNIWLRLGLRLAEFRPHHGVDIKRRSCGAASVDVG